MQLPTFSSETARNVAEVGMAFVAVAATVVSTIVIPTAIRVGPTIIRTALPFLTAHIQDANKKRIAEAIARAISRATSVYADAYRKAEKLAMAPGSDGGAEVTRLERDACMRTAWLAVVEDLKRDGSWDSLVEAMGGEEALSQMVVAGVMKAAHGNPIGD